VEPQYITDEFGITRANPNYTGGVFNPQDPYARNAMQPYWQSVDQAAGFPQNFTQTMASIESQGGQNLTSPTGAVGPFQFTGIAANQVGIPKAQTTDPYIGAQAAAELASQNRDRFMQAYGREPTGSELYLMHQQGASGAMAVLGTDPNTLVSQMTPTVQRNILAQGISGINSGSTVGDFANYFDQKYTQYSPFTGDPLQAQNSQMGGGYQPNIWGYGDDGFDTGFNAGGYYTGGTGNAQYQKGGSTGPQYVTDSSGITRAVQGQQSYGNNEYGYGGGYDPQAYGYQQNYSGGLMGGQNTTGYMNYSGQPDITVYGNDPYSMGTASYDQFGQLMGGSGGSTLYSATNELGGGLTMADAARQNAAFESVFQSGAQDHMNYEGQLNNLTANNGWTDTNVFQPQQVQGYTYQPQIATTTWGVNNPTVDYNIAGLNPMNNPGPIYL
jgi:hypothetical protein